MMPTLIKIGSNAFSWASPEVRKKLRRVALSAVAFSPFVASKRKELCRSRPDFTEDDRAIVAKIDCRISTADTMFEGDVKNYFLVGLSGLKAVDRVLQKCPNLVVKNVLDLPCGWGRVGRYLKARFPGAKLTGCDLMTDGVDFCAEKLGMTPVYSQPDFEKINLGQKYDLIWCGSLITHLKANDIFSLLQLFERHLNDNGVVVFTVHGDHVANQITGGCYPWIDPELRPRALESYRTDGVAFVPYPLEVGAMTKRARPSSSQSRRKAPEPMKRSREEEQYGFSLTSPTWIRSQCKLVSNWREVLFQPQGWDNLQDVYGYSKTKNGTPAI
jgi:2-polyprenyl-3-methyl-5-hydroxy-6-metoxy-1,4-benzoquinol methylase